MEDEGERALVTRTGKWLLPQAPRSWNGDGLPILSVAAMIAYPPSPVALILFASINLLTP